MTFLAMAMAYTPFLTEFGFFECKGKGKKNSFLDKMGVEIISAADMIRVKGRLAV